MTHHSSAAHWLVFIAQIVFIVIILILGARQMRRQAGVQKALLEAQARKRQGRVVPGGFLSSFPRLELPWAGTFVRIVLSPGSKNSPPATRVELAFRNVHDHHLNIYPESALARIAKSFGMQDIRVGNPSFDEAFIIHSNDVSFALSFLDPEIQSVILSLKGDLPSVAINRTRFTLTVPRLIDQEPDYDRLLDATTKILQRLGGLGLQ